MLFVVFFRYLFAVIFHKYCILIAGIRINKILRSTSYRVSYRRLLLHDISKFSAAEFWPYAEHFYGQPQDRNAFSRAWKHHVEHNDHHCEHFIDNYSPLVEQKVENLRIRPMPDEALLEMVADNLAASRSYEGYWPDGKQIDGWPWMTNGFDKFPFHPVSKLKFTIFLCAVGFGRVLPQPFDWDLLEKSDLSKEEKRKLSQLKSLIPK